MTSEYAAATSFLHDLAQNALFNAEVNTNRIWMLTEPSATNVKLREPYFGHKVGDPSLGPPPTLSSLLTPNDKYTEWIARLDDGADAWVAKYFPAVSACFKELPEQFLCDVISGVKPFGLDKTVFDLTWQRARDRQARANRGDRGRVYREFGQRGWTIPPGAMVAQLAAVDERAHDQLAEINREQAIKDADIRLDMLKFAEEQALVHKRGMLGVLLDFVRSWIAIPNDSIEQSRLKLQAQQTLYDALGKYYNVEALYEELRLKVEQARVDTDLGVSRNRIAAVQSVDDVGKAAALGSAVQGFSDMVAQAAQGAGSLVAQVESI